ncbi:MAG TPA: hypothetical protein EYO84_00035, partial [Planctomycetes bacterium]|nr:hypothetical protein [Planctomycetota bacterium]
MKTQRAIPTEFRSSASMALLCIVLVSIYGCAGPGGRTTADATGLNASTTDALGFEVQWNNSRNQVEISAGCRLLTTLRLDQQRPCLFPIYSPGGSMVLRRWPIEEAIEGESKDH